MCGPPNWDGAEQAGGDGWTRSNGALGEDGCRTASYEDRHGMYEQGLGPADARAGRSADLAGRGDPSLMAATGPEQAVLVRIRPQVQALLRVGQDVTERVTFDTGDAAVDAALKDMAAADPVTADQAEAALGR